MPTLCIRNGRVIDPEQELDKVRDVWAVDGRTTPDDFSADRADEEIDATGLLVMPGFVDVHVHLREPGNEEAETIESGCAAALAGGFTTIVCMPNTTPALDTVEAVEAVTAKAAALNGPRVLAAAALTKGRRGEKLADLASLAADGPGVAAFSDDGAGVEDEALLRKALAACAREGRPLAEHCEFTRLSAGATVHPDYPPEAETEMIERDIRLGRETGAHVHFQHLSAARSVELIRVAKASGARVTAEVTPHHLTLTCEDAKRGGANFKMNPPLRSEHDRQALVDGLKEGVIDMIATDHAPHTPLSKARPFADAPFGVIGMETAAAVVWTRLVKPGFLTPAQMVERMSVTPRTHITGAWSGSLIPGDRCDATLFDPEAVWRVDAASFKSKSRNCPFDGWRLEGRVVATIVDGKVVYRAALH